MSRLAYLDLASGASGDMILAALADAGRRAGVDVEGAVTRAVDGLDLGCSIAFEETTRGGLRCLHAEVTTDGTTHPPSALREAIARTNLPERTKSRAEAGLTALVEAEARVHGVDPEQVHLHELGSADTAADLVGAAAAFRALAVTRVMAAPVPLPRGSVETDHGTLPLPAPVTLELLRGIPVRGVTDTVELVTPTAVAILRAHGTSFGPPPSLVLEEVGIGGGTRETERPNICRVLLGRPQIADEHPSPARGPRGLRLERDVLLETNIDDQPPEGVGHALEALMAAGAKDAWITPIVMKKSRPAFQLSVLVDPGDEAAVLDVLFRETTTLGIRRRETVKWALPREELHVPVRGTNVRVKVGRLHGEVVNIAPEFEDCHTVAQRSGVPFKDVYAEASEKARRLLET